MFATCKDCGYNSWSAKDFSDHTHNCPSKPVPWEAYKEPEFPAAVPIKPKTVEEVLGIVEP